MTIPYPTEEDTTQEVVNSLNYWELLAALIKADIIDRRLYPLEELQLYAYRELLADPESLDLDIVTFKSWVTNTATVKLSNITFPPGTLRGFITDFYPSRREVLVELSPEFRTRHGVPDMRKLFFLDGLTKYKEGDEYGNTGDQEDGVESQSFALAPWMGGS